MWKYLGRNFVAGAAGALFILSGAVVTSAQTIVPGPWGEIADHDAPLSITTDKERITLFRRHQMRAISGHFRSIELVATYKAPLADLIQHDVAALVRHAQTLPGLFPSGTAMDDGKFGAKPEIWRQAEKFSRHLAGFQSAVDRLSRAVSEKSDLAQPLIGIRHECLACHQAFRVVRAN